MWLTIEDAGYDTASRPQLTCTSLEGLCPLAFDRGCWLCERLPHAIGLDTGRWFADSMSTVVPIEDVGSVTDCIANSLASTSLVGWLILRRLSFL